MQAEDKYSRRYEPICQSSGSSRTSVAAVAAAAAACVYSEHEKAGVSLTTVKWRLRVLSDPSHVPPATTDGRTDRQHAATSQRETHE